MSSIKAFETCLTWPIRVFVFSLSICGFEWDNPANCICLPPIRLLGLLSRIVFLWKRKTHPSSVTKAEQCSLINFPMSIPVVLITFPFCISELGSGGLFSRFFCDLFVCLNQFEICWIFFLICLRLLFRCCWLIFSSSYTKVSISIVNLYHHGNQSCFPFVFFPKKRNLRNRKTVDYWKTPRNFFLIFPPIQFDCLSVSLGLCVFAEFALFYLCCLSLFIFMKANHSAHSHPLLLSMVFCVKFFNWHKKGRCVCGDKSVCIICLHLVVVVRLSRSTSSHIKWRRIYAIKEPVCFLLTVCVDGIDDDHVDFCPLPFS